MSRNVSTWAVVIVSILIAGTQSIALGTPDCSLLSTSALDYSFQTIFVKGQMVGWNGVLVSGDFIIDTGANRTSIDKNVAAVLNLTPSGQELNSTPSGSTSIQLARAHTITALNVAQDGMTVMLDDLSIYPKVYGRKVLAVLGTDFFRNQVLAIDFVHRRITASRQMCDSHIRAVIELESEKGLLFVPTRLPNGRMLRLLLDTGSESGADFVVYESSAGNLKLEPPIRTRFSTDSRGIGTKIDYGSIKEIGIGKLSILKPIVGIAHQRPPAYFTKEWSGEIGPFMFERSSIAIDFPRNRLYVMLYYPRSQS